MKQCRACGRPNCIDCPKAKIGRCHATPQQRDCQECTCGLQRHPPAQKKR